MGCYWSNQLFICDQFGVLARGYNDTCLRLLYNQQLEVAQRLCKFEIAPITEPVYQLKSITSLFNCPRLWLFLSSVKMAQPQKDTFPRVTARSASPQGARLSSYIIVSLPTLPSPSQRTSSTLSGNGTSSKSPTSWTSTRFLSSSFDSPTTESPGPPWPICNSSPLPNKRSMKWSALTKNFEIN